MKKASKKVAGTKGAETKTLTPCHSCPLRKLASFRAFTEAELSFMETFKSGELTVDPGATILLDGTNSAHLFTVLSGWAFRLKTLEDGRRQILNFVLPGDFIGLQGSVFDKMQHSVEALTATVLCVFPREKVWSLFQNHPGLAFDTTWLAAREETMLDEHLLSVGQRRASERMAYMLLHLFRRIQQTGTGHKKKVEFPFTQQHLADALGFSIVHTNKTLKRLRATGTFKWTGTQFEVIDEDKLIELAGHPNLPGGVRPLL
jgi:CRP/FNR family transcriptional regulator, anaerobic regulatory protein